MAKEGKKSRWYQYSFEDVYGKEWKTKPQVPHAQLTLDDIYDSSVLGQADPVKAKMDYIRKCRICEKTIISGSFIECNIYPVWNNRKNTPKTKKSRESREAQKNLNNKNAQLTVIRLLNTNFAKGDLLITLTYKDGYYPTLERARKDINNYIKALKRERKKQGLDELKYIYVIEYVPEGEDTKKVRIHHHIIINAMDRDVAESKWKFGRSESKIAQPDDDFGLEGYGRYITKQEKRSHHRWAASRNLKRPIERVNTTTLTKKKMYDMVKSGDDISSIFEKIYKNKFAYTGSRIFYSDYVGGFYIYGTLKTKKGVVVMENKEVAPVQHNLPKSRVFVDMHWTGSIKCGIANFSIVFETVVNGKTYTVEKYGKISGTTKHRAALIITDYVLSQFTKRSDIELHIDNTLLAAGINDGRFKAQREAGYKGIRNSALIDGLLSDMALGGHVVSVVNEKKNEYSEAEFIQLRKRINKMQYDFEMEDERE